MGLSNNLEFYGNMPSFNYELLNAAIILSRYCRNARTGKICAERLPAVTGFVQSQLFPNNKLGKKTFTKELIRCRCIESDNLLSMNLLVVPGGQGTDSFGVFLNMKLFDPAENCIFTSRMIPTWDFDRVPDKVIVESIAENIECTFGVESVLSMALTGGMQSVINLESEMGLVSLKLGESVITGEFMPDGELLYFSIPRLTPDEYLHEFVDKIRDIQEQEEITTNQELFLKDLRAVYQVLNIWLNTKHIKGNTNSDSVYDGICHRTVVF